MKQASRLCVDWMLECAVAVSWTDLLPSGKSGLIHVDYCFSPNGYIESLKLWLSTIRGHWQLACEYRMAMSTDHNCGVRFEQGHKSEELACNLEFIMQHQDSFLPALNHGRNGLLQVHAPTPPETETASLTIVGARLELDSIPAELSA